MKKITIVLFLIISLIGKSQNLALDSTFGNNGVVVDKTIGYVPKNIFFENNKYILVLNDGVCSRNYDGSKDTTFGNNGMVTFFTPTETFLTKGGKIQNGFIYVFGQVSNNNTSNNSNIFIAKISTSGVFDSTFGTNGLLKLDLGSNAEIINDIVINPNGNIIAVGEKNAVIFMTKINSDGTLDTSLNTIGYKTFNFDANENSTGASIYNYQGNYLLVGSSKYPSNIYNPTKYLVLINIDENGNFINSFGTNGIKAIDISNGNTGSYTVLNSKLVSNNLYFSYYYSWSYNNQHNSLLKYNLESDIVSEITYVPSVYFDYVVDSNEDILITGTERCSPTTESNCSRDFNISKKNSMGLLDTTFNSTGNYSYNFFPSDLISDDRSSLVYQHADGKIIIAGYIYNPYSPIGVGSIGLAIIRIMDSPLSNNEFYSKENFVVSPNPANKYINISYKEDIILDKIELIDSNGRQILFQTKEFDKVNIENLENGIYFINIFSNDKKTTLKFIKN